MLNGTTAEIVERKALRINPAKTCQPIGAMYAALGIHGCMPHSHGSQGCCSYHRSHLTRHFKEPVMATTSSFTEGASVFGGLANLTQALKNIFTIYNPEIVAVHTTCLSEVIGDDIPTIIKRPRDEGIIPEGKIVIHANTPSFVGSHVTGFSNMVMAMVKYLSENTGDDDQPGQHHPGLRRAGRHARTQAPRRRAGRADRDVSRHLQRPRRSAHRRVPHVSGRRQPPSRRSESTGDSMATHRPRPLRLASWPPPLLESKCNVPAAFLELPIGIGATDRVHRSLRGYAGVEVPAAIELERGRLIDMMSDMHQYFHGKRVAVSGDPDHVIALTQFLLELDMKPVYVITGSPGNQFEKRMHEILDGPVPDAKIKQSADLFELHQWIKNEPVDLLITNTYGKYIARVENMPFVRFGFPILDRIGHRFFPTVGYMPAPSV